MCSGVQANPQHTARITGEVLKVHYFCHPLYGKEVEVLERQRHGGEYYYLVLFFDNSRWLLPAWMTDEVICRALVVQARPVCSLSALRSLGEHLDQGS